MISLYGRVKDLKDNLVESQYERNLVKTEKRVSSEEIQMIRRSLMQVESDEIKKKSEFLNEIHDFGSMLLYFDNLDDSWEDEGAIFNHINRVFDPILIYLKDINYEVTIRKITPTDKDILKFHEVISKMDSMEEAYEKNNFGQVTTLSNTILTSLFKELCFFYNIQYSDNETFTALYKKVQDKLKLNPTLYNKNEKHKKALSFTSKIHKLFVHINELRNIYSDSHGIIGKESINFSSLPKHHYKLIVDSTKTITNFLIESNFYQRQK